MKPSYCANRFLPPLAPLSLDYQEVGLPYQICLRTCYRVHPSPLSPELAGPGRDYYLRSEDQCHHSKREVRCNDTRCFSSS
ncbi:hypothetical protein PoB_005055300 [Plakobranchus ocellatus]|uniref:Uncharacterized protein n=1 Tax=Plakobranchus ocellatus TaxID=259542 RepID=A0AAV4BXU3_9GAST|nr:hypothetical protein PoB_005055300 [Plakobranchus ocellatus]